MKLNKFEIYRKMRASTYIKMMRYNINIDQLYDMLSKAIPENHGVGVDDIDDMVEFMHFIEEQVIEQDSENDLKLYVVFSPTYLKNHFVEIDTTMSKLFIDKNNRLYILVYDNIKHYLFKEEECDYMIKDFHGGHYLYDYAVEILGGKDNDNN